MKTCLRICENDFAVIQKYLFPEDGKEAIAFAQQLGVKEAWIVHMSHHIEPHALEEQKLPKGIHLAYDGEVIEFGSLS